MEHIYPAFECGRIMKKELLWALRDYSYLALQLQYQNYSDGIISGCRVWAEEDCLIVGSGIVKCQDFIFLITEEERVKYTSTDDFVSLKFRVKSKEKLPDYTRYITEFVLDDKLERSENELEVCRFKLKQGAKLRTEYKDFYDIQTEFDTVNLAYATWAGMGQNTMSKEVTDYFARKVLECGEAKAEDVQFAYILLHGREAAAYDILKDYMVRKKSILPEEEPSLEEIFRQLEEILEIIRKGNSEQRARARGLENRMIILD